MGNKTSNVIERKAFISNIQKYNMYDGPGIRTIVFFKGCPLRCKWCANPENLERKYQVMGKNVDSHCGQACASVCPVGKHSVSKETLKHEINHQIDCIGCRKCEKACTQSAFSVVGEMKTISELLEIIEEDRMFYELSGGGVTLSGGEVLMQHDAAANLLAACKQVGINTAIETSGYAKLEHVLQVAEFTDLFLYDIKHIDSARHYEFTGVRNELILSNLKELIHRRYNVKIRMPLLKGVNDKQQDIEGVALLLKPFQFYKNFKGIDLLPYHKMGVNKYTQLGLEYPMENYPDPSLSDEELDQIESWMKQHELPVSIIRH